MASEKTKVVEYLFFKYWDKDKKKLTRSVMSLSDVQEAIQYCNREFGFGLSTKNPANFMKDIVRSQNASRNWPNSLKDLRYTAVQRTGGGDVFEFVEYTTDQTEPFPDKYRWKPSTPTYKLQTISMSLAAKRLGRSDEPWLIQTAVNLRVIESHLSIVSDLPIVELTHLQMSVKLRSTEIDALFLGLLSAAGKEEHVIITCEAKGDRERILDHQIINQVQAAFQETDVDLVIPIALRAVRHTGFYVVEFKAVRRNVSNNLNSLQVEKEAVFELCPPVPGI